MENLSRISLSVFVEFVLATGSQKLCLYLFNLTDWLGG